LKLINDYFGKCLDSNPLLRFDGGLEKSSVIAILYWLVSGTSFKRIDNKSKQSISIIYSFSSQWKSWSFLFKFLALIQKIIKFSNF
jgi:hypothetical protein